jgi:hypothetical protein
MFVLANRDLELACDESVVHRYGVQQTQTAYAYTLIGMAEFKSIKNKQLGFAPLYSGFGKTAIEERIVSIMKTKKNTFLSAFTGCALVTLLTVGVLVASAATDDTATVEPDETPAAVADDESEVTSATVATYTTAPVAETEPAETTAVTEESVINTFEDGSFETELDVLATRVTNIMEWRYHLLLEESHMFDDSYERVIEVMGGVDGNDIALAFYSTDGVTVYRADWCEESREFVWENGKMPENVSISHSDDGFFVFSKVVEQD